MNVETEVVECVGTIIERDGNYVLECVELPFDRYWTPEGAPSWMQPGVSVRMTVTMRLSKEEPTNRTSWRDAIGCAPAIPGSMSIEEAVRRVRQTVGGDDTQTTARNVVQDIVDNWDEWSGEAESESQRFQNPDVWREIMISRVVSAMRCGVNDAVSESSVEV